MKEALQFFRLTSVLYFLIALLAVATSVTVIATIFENRKVTELYENWTDHNGTTARKIAFLSLLKDGLGYGGAIHNLKNYILRGNDAYLIKAHKSQLDIRVILNGYRHFGATEDENRHLTALEDVLNQYEEAVIEAEKLRQHGLPAIAIDTRVKIDDTAAIEALSQLDLLNVDQRQKNVLKLSQQILSIHSLVITALTGIGILLVIVTLALGWFLHQRLIRPIRRLAESFTSIDPSSENNQRLPVRSEKWQDELDALAIAGNTYLDTAAAHLNNHKKAEQNLAVALKKAEAANEAKSLFLSSMSHELRTPMNAILGFSQVLEMSDSENQLSLEQKQCVDQILVGGNTLISLIDGVLTYAGLEDDTPDESGTKWSLASALAIPLVEARTQCKARELSMFDGELLNEMPEVYGNQPAVTRAFKEILSNAVLYSPRRGQIFLSSTIAEGSFVRLSVRDEGKGISFEHQKELFIPFRRLGMENSSIPGIGLGLTVAKRLLDRTGARMGFQSSPGDGSTFWIDVPMMPAEASSL